MSVSPTNDIDNVRADPVDRDVQALQHRGRYPVLHAAQPEQHVLGADVVVPQGYRLFLRKHDHLARFLSEPPEHPPMIASGASPRTRERPCAR